MSRFKEGIIGPTSILFVICFFVAFLLAFTYSLTAPVIEAAKKSAVEEVSFPDMPAPEEFVQLHVEDLPRGVTEAFMTKDLSYFVFKVVTNGYGGAVTYFVGLDANGNYTGIKMGENTETPGLGNKVASQEYVSRYLGQRDPNAVAAVTGVTITTNSLRAALELSNETFDIIREGGIETYETI